MNPIVEISPLAKTALWKPLEFGLPHKQKIGKINFGFEKVKLERNADDFRREFWA